MMEMTARLSHLERPCSTLKTAVAGNPEATNRTILAKDPSVPREVPVVHMQPVGTSQTDPELGESSPILSPIASLDRAARQETGLPAISPLRTTTRGERCNGADFRPSFDVFFQYFNPLHPLLSENQFRADFDDFVFNDGAKMTETDRNQFLAPMYLVQCEMDSQQNSSGDQNALLGWREFRIAETVLGHAEWLGRDTLPTIQCLLIKARFLLYHEKYNLAYDTMAMSVRLCFQTGLNNQPGWSSLGLDDFEFTMRQRLFWCLFQLERAVALNCGLPYLMHSTDFNVGLPRSLDDCGLFPRRPLPGETSRCSPVPYLLAVVQWAHLCGEMWDKIFSASAERLVASALLASLDVRISAIVDQQPAQLQYKPPSIHRGSTERTEAYMRRQSVVFHLRMNSLRLLIRQEVMLSLKFSTQMAEEVLQIATDSIDVVQASLSFSDDQSARWFSTIFLTGAITTLSCIIIKVDSSQDVCASAALSFKRAVALLESISNGFTLATRMIHRFQAILNNVNKAVVLRQPESVPDTTDQQGGDADQRWINILEDFGHSSNADAANLQLSQYLVSHRPTPAMGEPAGWDVLQDSDWMPTVW